MSISLVNIGFGNVISVERIISVVNPDSSPVKRMISEARDSGMLIDATFGRRTRAAILMDSDHIILSSIQTETISQRIEGKN